MPLIKVELLKGRSREQKRALARELTDAFVRTAGGKADSVWIIFRDVEKEDWAAGGALLADRLPD